jgi:HTH-type transcriptional regulator/antitoxin HigA
MISRAESSVTVQPVRTEAEYEAALLDIDSLMNARQGTPDGDLLDVLVTLVHAYEVRHYPVPPPDPVDAIRFRMEQAGLRPRDLEPYIGSRARVSEVLNRRRSLTLPMIRRLTDGLQIAAEILVREAPSVTHRKRRTRATTTAAATKVDKRKRR